MMSPWPEADEQHQPPGTRAKRKRRLVPSGPLSGGPRRTTRRQCLSSEPKTTTTPFCRGRIRQLDGRCGRSVLRP